MKSNYLGLTSLLLACHSTSLVPLSSSREAGIHIGPGEVVKIRQELYGCLMPEAISEQQVHRLEYGNQTQGVSCDQGIPYLHASALQPRQFVTLNGHQVVCLDEPIHSHSARLKILSPGEVTDQVICANSEPIGNRGIRSRLNLAPDIHRMAMELSSRPFRLPFYDTFMTPENLLCMYAPHPDRVSNISDGMITLCSQSGEIREPISISHHYVPNNSEFVSGISCMSHCPPDPVDTEVVLPLNHGFACTNKLPFMPSMREQGGQGGAKVFVCTTYHSRSTHYSPVQYMQPGERTICQGVVFVCAIS